MSVRNIYLQKFCRADHKLGAFINNIIPNAFKGYILDIRNSLMKHNLKNTAGKKLNPEFRQTLREYYRESNESLERQLNLDLSSWYY